MGSGEVGGNGSVEWSVDVNDPKWVVSEPANPKGHHQGGADEGGKPGEDFKITLEVPADATAKAKFIEDLQNAANDAKAGKPKVVLNLAIEQYNPDQIQINWPNK